MSGYGYMQGGDLRDVLRRGHAYVRQHKLVSRGLALVRHPVAQRLSQAARVLGYGEGYRAGVMAHHRRRAPRRHHGAGARYARRSAILY